MSRRRGDRQRKSEDENDGLSTAGKVVLGVAAAAAGAAIGYFGSRLLSAWLAEPEEEKPKKLDDDEQKQLSKAEKVNDGDAACMPSPASTSDQPDAVDQLSLHEQLLHYYREYVDIPGDKVQATQQLVDEVTSAVRKNYFRGLALKIGDMVSFGSLTEGLQVIRPDCVDVMIPVMFDSHCHAQQALVGGRQVPGRYLITFPDDITSRELCDEEQTLVTHKLLDALQLMVQEVVVGRLQYVAELQPRQSHNATAITLRLRDQLTINFVPAVIIDNHLFLPVASPVRLSEQSDTAAQLWTESFVKQEKWSIDRFSDSSVCGHVVVLKVLKAIRLNHRQQFGAVSSYHFKTLLFHVLEDLPDSCEWDCSAVGERLIDLLTRLTDVLAQHHMLHYFNQNVNVMDDVPVETCNNLAKFLRKKLAHNDIVSLLKKNY